jgi:hypothetical protein
MNMDDFDPNFDLSKMTETVSDNNYLFYGMIFIGVLIIGYGLYAYFTKKTVTFQDKLDVCYDGVCDREYSHSHNDSNDHHNDNPHSAI